MEGGLVYLTCLAMTLRGIQATTTWHDSMVESCGSNVDDLFTGPNDYKGDTIRCRLMRKAFQCVEATSKTNQDLVATWSAMTTTGIVDKIGKNVNDTSMTLRGIQATTTWHDSMVESCGSNVDDLFTGPNDYKGDTIRCRLMRKAFQCVEATSKTNQDLVATWSAMTTTGIVDKIGKNVNDTCQRESLRLCVLYSVEEDMRECYTRAGLTPRDTFTTEYLSQHCVSMNTALRCMRHRMFLCPDDEYIQPQIQGLEAWITELHDACPGLPRSIESPSNINDKSRDFYSSSYRPDGCRTLTATFLVMLTYTLKIDM